ncbi:hypothetical protein [Actinomadura sp. NEAU-AAG7]|uniref:hypothetical protein n=1 Tax=Actinomadura sp. NEAU-AAG7 TaxID=2839640 RepID=UPI001BE493CC|nr:hypothetical protein [Actinomadura sp. NEAU-AAG7]MBT2213455.1 hypothetical protein [Actinomadura sp. NEAU-AAG7]
MTPDMPTLRVEVAFTVGASTSTLLHLDDPGRGRLDTGSLGATSTGAPVWEDITPWARAVSITRGAGRVDTPIVQYEAGTLAVTLDNSDRRFDPSNLDGPYVDPINHTTQVTAMRAIRVLATWANVTYELYRGFVDSWGVDWIAPAYSECTVTATDAFKVLAGIDRPALTTPVGTGETTGARITRVLDSAQWPTADRVLATGDSAVQATTLEGAALGEMQTATDAELGELYIDAGGRVVFRHRTALLTETRSAEPQALFGDGGGVELPYQDLDIATDDSTFFNTVRVTRSGGTEQVATDTASQTLYYPRTFKPGDDLPLMTDTDALNYAQWILYISRAPELRFVELTVNPRSDPSALFPHALGRALGDRITVTRRPPGGGVITADQFIRGISHEISPQSWVTRWTLQSASKFGSFFTLDNVTLGRLDSNALAY